MSVAESHDAEVTFPDLLGFWTGARSVPPGGFADPARLRIEFFTVEPGSRRLPSSSTCGLVLLLPRGVEDPDEFAKTMSYVLLNTEGFGRL